MGNLLLILAGCVAVLSTVFEPVAARAGRTFTNGWVNGRATYFGQDAWSLHHGSCGFGFVCPNRWSNELTQAYDLVAISDKSPLFHGTTGAQCGQCLEVACRNAVFTDRYNERLVRTSMCKDTSASVKVKIVDTCACRYAPNAASNSRWCCGDAPHLDVSKWALDKLVKDSTKWGVFAIKYRTISCTARLRKDAKQIPLARDPHANMRGNTNCAAQGGVSSESKTKTRAITPRKPKSRHSAKYWSRLNLLKSSKKHSRRYKSLVKAYYKQFNSKMQRIRNSGHRKPH